MDPSDLSLAIRHIASKLEASLNPSRDLIVRDLSGLISKLSSEESHGSVKKECEGCHKHFEMTANSKLCPDCAKSARGASNMDPRSRLASDIMEYTCEEGHVFSVSGKGISQSTDIHTKVQCPVKNCKSPVKEKGVGESAAEYKKDVSQAKKS